MKQTQMTNIQVYEAEVSYLIESLRTVLTEQYIDQPIDIKIMKTQSYDMKIIILCNNRIISQLCLINGVRDSYGYNSEAFITKGCQEQIVNWMKDVESGKFAKLRSAEFVNAIRKDLIENVFHPENDSFDDES